MKVVINSHFGGFALSERAEAELKRAGLTVPDDDADPAFRSDPRLVHVLERMTGAADGEYSSLAVIEIPDGVEFQIEDYDGREWVAERHRRWGCWKDDNDDA